MAKINLTELMNIKNRQIEINNQLIKCFNQTNEALNEVTSQVVGSNSLNEATSRVQQAITNISKSIETSVNELAIFYASQINSYIKSNEITEQGLNAIVSELN